ncbi:MAG TPA: hypothetical protein VF172_12035 [Nitrososphaera sp.]
MSGGLLAVAIVAGLAVLIAFVPAGLFWSQSLLINMAPLQAAAQVGGSMSNATVSTTEIRITEVELSSPDGSQWFEVYNPTDEAFSTPILVNQSNSEFHALFTSVTFQPREYKVIEFRDASSIANGEGFSIENSELHIFASDSLEIDRTPRLSDTFADTRTWQLDRSDNKWVFAESTKNWYANNVEDRTGSSITNVRPLVTYNASDGGFRDSAGVKIANDVRFNSLDWAGDTLVYSLTLDDATALWTLKTDNLGSAPSKPQKIEFEEAIYSPIEPKLNPSATRLLFIGSTQPPGSPGSMPTLYFANTDGSGLQQVGLGITKADWINDTAIVYERSEAADVPSGGFQTPVMAIYDIRNGGKILAPRVFSDSLWIEDVSPSGRLALAQQPVNYYESKYVILDLSTFRTFDLEAEVPTERYWGGGYRQFEAFCWAADDSHLFYLNPEAFGALSIHKNGQGIYTSSSKVVIATFDPNNADAYSSPSRTISSVLALNSDGKHFATIINGDTTRNYPSEIVAAELTVAVPEFGPAAAAIVMAASIVGAVTATKRFQ